MVTLNFNDGGNLQFSLQGLGSSTTVDTAPVAGVYTEIFKAKVTSMTGEGSSDGSGPFVATGSLTVTGKASLSL